jgi:hypothetical protein
MYDTKEPVCELISFCCFMKKCKYYFKLNILFHNDTHTQISFFICIAEFKLILFLTMGLGGAECLGLLCIPISCCLGKNYTIIHLSFVQLHIIINILLKKIKTSYHLGICCLIPTWIEEYRSVYEQLSDLLSDYGKPFFCRLLLLIYQ